MHSIGYIAKDIYSIRNKTAAPAFQLLKELGDKTTVLPIEDRLIRRADVAKVLGVSKSTITPFVKQGYLKPVYVNSDQVSFWLSEVKAIAKDKPWRIEEVGIKTNQIMIRELNGKKLPKGGY